QPAENGLGAVVHVDDPASQPEGGFARRVASRQKIMQHQSGRVVLLVARPAARSEEHTSELQSRFDLVCRLLLEKKKTKLVKVLDLALQSSVPSRVVVTMHCVATIFTESRTETTAPSHRFLLAYRFNIYSVSVLL